LTRAKSTQVFKGESLDLEARIIAAIGLVGPRNIAEISRMTGAHQETVRYQIKKRLAKLGFRYHAEVNHCKLGLVQHWATLHFARPYYSSAVKILDTLNQVGYLTYYTKALPQGQFLAIFTLPSGTTEEFRLFLARLVDSKVLAGFTLDEAVVSKHPPMNPKFFNFSSGTWEVEWNKVRGQSGSPLQVGETGHGASPDYYDLLIIKELQKDATQHMVKIARSLKVHEKTLEYHYRSHVMKEKLVPSFVVRWTNDIDKKLAHSVDTARLTFRNLDQRDLIRVQRAISKIPYLWAEDVLRDGTYIATIHIPVNDLLSTLTYLNDEAGELGSPVEMAFIKHNEANLYTIPHHMFKDGEWKFDIDGMAAAVSKASGLIEK
jgi:DNA-binding Lrp family transcriptional regulator